MRGIIEYLSIHAEAGFWYGLWHGIIAVITLVVHIFDQSIRVYESNNTGGWYDLGFLMGVLSVWGGGSKAKGKSRRKKQQEREWQEVCSQAETKILCRMKEWVEDETGAGSDPEWQELGDKVEKKLKRKIREWAEKE